MRVLVTGAAGFMGRNALLAVPSSWQVVALYRPGNPEFLSFIEAHQLQHVQPIACDLTDARQVEQAISLAGASFDRCLYMASNTSIPASIERPLQDLTTNVLGLLHVLERCSFEHLVFLSSGAVYQGLAGLVNPTVAVSPHLPYAISKVAAEQYIQSYMRYRHTIGAAIIVRFFGAYGPYEPARKLYTKLVRRFALEGDPHFTVMGDGENYVDAMYIDDAISALLAVLNSPPAEGARTIDLGVGSRESINQVVTRVAHVFGLEPEIEHVGTTPEYIRFVVDPQPVSLAYGFRPMVSLEEGIKRLADHLGWKETR